ncbi:MAG: hypothetical protein RLZZ50_1215 [Verrucomicrobiota bacterium]|jgi:hypothetical protein
MKRLLLLLLGLGLLYAVGALAWNVRETTRYFVANGREATLEIQQRYNAERWASPLPVKKILTYTARLQPKYDVLIETDQELKPGQKITIRFLTRDVAAEAVALSKRPLVNTIRLRGAEDGAPVKLEETDAFDRLVDKAMGPPAEGVYVKPRAVAEAAPTREKPTVPFLIEEPGDTTWSLIVRNSRIGEWVFLLLGVLIALSFLSAAYERQKEAKRLDSRGKKFVHPSLRNVQAAAPEAQRKISYVPKGDQEVALTDAEKKQAAAKAAPPPTPAPIPAPKSAATPIPFKPSAPPPPSATPAANTAAEPKPLTELPSLRANETAPPMPINREEPALKLRRKTGGGGSDTTPPAA